MRDIAEKLRDQPRQYTRQATPSDLVTLAGILSATIYTPFEVKTKREFIIGMRTCKCGCAVQLPENKMVFLPEGMAGSKMRAYTAECAERTLARRALRNTV